jgi:FixJ family two-component response regulator
MLSSPSPERVLFGEAPQRSLRDVPAELPGIETRYLRRPCVASYEKNDQPMKPASTGHSGHPLVLVVDDDPMIRELIADVLASIGLQSKAYASASEFFGSKVPDQATCLILDVRLPGLSGFDLQAELAKKRINIPIIFVSGYADIRMSVKAMKAGAVEFLTKPFREQDLLDAVRAALDRDRERREYEDKINDLHRRYNVLSAREQEVMIFVAAGLMNKQVAAEIGIAEVTAKVHRHKLMKKLGARSLPDLVRMAGILGLPHAKGEQGEWQTNDHNHHTLAGLLRKS